MKAFLVVFQEKLQEHFTKLWLLFEPILFGLAGYRTDLSKMDWSFMLKGVLCLSISLTVSRRCYLAKMRLELNNTTGIYRHEY